MNPIEGLNNPVLDAVMPITGEKDLQTRLEIDWSLTSSGLLLRAERWPASPHVLHVGLRPVRITGIFRLSTSREMGMERDAGDSPYQRKQQDAPDNLRRDLEYRNRPYAYLRTRIIISDFIYISFVERQILRKRLSTTKTD